MCYALLLAISFQCQLVMTQIWFVCDVVSVCDSHSGKRGSVAGLMLGQICVYVCGEGCKVELMDKVS